MVDLIPGWVLPKTLKMVLDAYCTRNLYTGWSYYVCFIVIAACTLAGHVFFMLVTMMLMGTGYDIIPIVFDSLPLDIRDDSDFLRGQAWDYRSTTDE